MTDIANATYFRKKYYAKSQRPFDGAETGAITIIFLVALGTIVVTMMMALDLGRLHNRQIELQNIADAAALAAARELDGTDEGISNARSRAAAAARAVVYDYGSSSVVWSDAALTFSTGADAPSSSWSSSVSPSSAADILFAKVDTAALDRSLGRVTPVFSEILLGKDAFFDARATAIAGRSTTNVTPIAICAMSSQPAASRPPRGELVEYGFRRGVGYNLMALNPNDVTAVSFAVNPIDPPGATVQAKNSSAEIIAPFVCNGSVPMARLTGSQITVSRGFPLNQLYPDLNTRFGKYTGTKCKYRTAPPDFNVKEYHKGAIPWMPAATGFQGAMSTDAGSKLRTVADIEPSPVGTTAAQYGPLWAYSKAVPFSAYTAKEPVNGYPTFRTTDWSSLYSPGQPSASNYPSPSPYMTSGGPNYEQPNNNSYGRGLRHRRVLNVPLLQCPVAGGSNTTATVLAVGRFFMTVPATSTELHAEFAGIASEGSLAGPVELYK